MRNALVAANAIFDDLGDLRKPEYLYRIVQDALERGQERKTRPLTGRDQRKDHSLGKREIKERTGK